MTLTLQDLLTQDSVADYEAELLLIADTLGLQTSSWQSGSMVRTIISIIANVLSTRDNIDYKLAAAGYLDLAADPTISPEPVSGEIYSGSWLDILAKSVFDVDRRSATYAAGIVLFQNSLANTHGPYLPGTFQIGIGSYTYTNLETFTIYSGDTPDVRFQADIIGVGANQNSTPANIEIVNPIVGVDGYTTTLFIGLDYESNAQLVARCRAKLASLSSGGAANAYDYFAKNIPTEDPPMVFSGLRSTPHNAVDRIRVSSTYAGTVDVIVANANGAYAANEVYLNPTVFNINNITNNSGEIEITTSSPHGYTTGDTVYIFGVNGTTEANNDSTNIEWTITNTGSNTFTLDGSVFTNTYVGSTGTVQRTSDFDLIDANLSAYCLPTSITLNLTSAVNQTITVAYTIWVDSAFANQDTIDLIDTNIGAYINSYPIGGVGGTISLYIPFDAVLGEIFKASNHIRQATLTLNGGTSNIAFTGSNYVAIASISTPIIHII